MVGKVDEHNTPPCRCKEKSSQVADSYARSSKLFLAENDVHYNRRNETHKKRVHGMTASIFFGAAWCCPLAGIV
jgi:hypothetical protein